MLHEIKVLQESDFEAVFRLFKKNEDYFITVEGHAANEDSVKEFFYDIPPSKKLEDKKLYGIYQNKLLIGVIDILTNYPNDDTWFIGLLMIDPEYKRQGIGKEVHEWIRNTAKNSGKKYLRLGIIQDNLSASIFWQTLGYKKVDEKIKTYGDKTSIVMVMSLKI